MGVKLIIPEDTSGHAGQLSVPANGFDLFMHLKKKIYFIGSVVTLATLENNKTKNITQTKL